MQYDVQHLQILIEISVKMISKRKVYRGATSRDRIIGKCT
jgi:hypothetical protein